MKQKKSVPQNLKELQETWYKKLKKSGFEDIESNEDNLKVWSSIFFSRHSIEQIQAKQAYYQMATNFLEDYRFESRRDKIIWEYHANGVSYRDITKILRKVRIKLSHVSIQHIVHKLQAAMYMMYKMPTKDPQ